MRLTATCRFVAALFFGLKAAVLAIVLEAVVRVGKRALKNDAMVALAAAAFVGIFFFDMPFPDHRLRRRPDRLRRRRRGVAAFAGRAAAMATARKDERDQSIACSAMSCRDHARPTLRAPCGCRPSGWRSGSCRSSRFSRISDTADVFSQIAVFFSKMAMVTFGGAYAVLAYVAQQAVENYGWLKPGEMLDGLGMAETTPGPLIMVLQFVGFMAAFRDPGGLSPMLAGTLGGLLATWVTFTPCFLWIFLGAPFIEVFAATRRSAGALSAITAAVVGVILNLALWFAIHTMFREVSPVRAYGLSFDAPVLSSADPGRLLWLSPP